MSKYEALGDFLKNQRGDRVPMSVVRADRARDRRQAAAIGCQVPALVEQQSDKQRHDAGLAQRGL